MDVSTPLDHEEKEAGVMTDILQWVDKVTKYSSQYDNESHSAIQLCGPRNVFPTYGNLPGAWATGEIDANQFVEVEFKIAVVVTGIEIYETFHAGGTKYVAAWNGHQWVTLWQTPQVSVIHQTRIFCPPLAQGFNFKTKNLRIGIDCTAAGKSVGLDAIMIIGKPDIDENTVPQTNFAEEVDNGLVKEQWVKKVKQISPQYTSSGWRADKLIGEPKVYPNYADYQMVYRTTEFTDSKQFAEVEFDKAVYVVGIDIYETYHAGGTKRVAALNDKDQWVILWETAFVQNIVEARIFSPPLMPTKFKTKTIRIEIDCEAAGWTVEIDAVKLKGKIDNKDDAVELPKKPSKLNDNSSASSVTEEQWVHKVKKFSSQYDENSWNAGQLCGKPKVYPQYGDISGAWAMAEKDAHQYVELEYTHSVYVTGIAIYETFHAGGIKRISAKNDKKQWVTLWETNNVTDIAQSRIFSPPVQTNFKTDDIRIDVDCSAAGTWVEIDAVKLIGKRDNKDDAVQLPKKPSKLNDNSSASSVTEEQWVHKVKKFSSQYDENSWNAGQLCGKPKVYPQYGDISGAWAMAEIDAHQYVELEYTHSVYVTGIAIYETFHAGGIKRISAKNDKKQWVTLWETNNVTDIAESRIFSPPVQTNFKTDDIRIDVDCSAAGTWVEIDAVKLIGKRDNKDDAVQLPKKPSKLSDNSSASSVTEEQWVHKVKKFSSQYDENSWNAGQLCGKPKVYPQYGDISGAWAMAEKDAHQYVELEYTHSVYVTGIAIYETFHAGGIKRISAKNDKKQWVTLWETNNVTDIAESRIFSPPVQTNFKTDDIRIDVDCSAAGTWVEIDAVKLIGKRDNKDDAVQLPKKPSKLSDNSSASSVTEEQWVHKVKKFSSQYDENSWNAGQLCGKPKVYPQYGDISGAWAMAETDAHQYVELEYKHSVYVTGIAIYETFHAGGIKRISAKNDKKQWVTVWETNNVTDIAESRIFSPPVQTNFKTNDIRIDVDCSAAGTWVEIDAVKLISKRDIKVNSVHETEQEVVDTIPYAYNEDLDHDWLQGCGSWLAPAYVEPSNDPYQGPVKEQWVKKVTKFSSQYDDSSWKADHVCGRPNVYPQYGDVPKAWATGTIDAHQFVEVKFKKAVKVTGIDIYETYHAGGTRRIAALRNKTEWVTLWETDRVTDIHQARIFSPPLKDTNFQTKNIRVEIDCTVANTWVEIDAIKLKGRKVYDDSSSSSDSDSDDGRKKKKKKSKKSKKSKKKDTKSKACILL